MTFSTNSSLLTKLCCERGTDSDWRRFNGQYRSLVGKWCLQAGVPSSDLEDLFQDTMIKLIAALPSYERSPNTKFRSWLKTVVLNTLIDRMRISSNRPFPFLLADSELNRKQASRDLQSNLDSLAEQLVEPTIPAAEILAAVQGRFKPQSWDAFIRRELLHDEVEDIALDLGIKKASVYQACSRVRKLIREESVRYFRSQASPGPSEPE